MAVPRKNHEKRPEPKGGASTDWLKDRKKPMTSNENKEESINSCDKYTDPPWSVTTEDLKPSWAGIGEQRELRKKHAELITKLEEEYSRPILYAPKKPYWYKTMRTNDVSISRDFAGDELIIKNKIEKAGKVPNTLKITREILEKNLPSIKSIRKDIIKTLMQDGRFRNDWIEAAEELGIPTYTKKKTTISEYLDSNAGSTQSMIIAENNIFKSRDGNYYIWDDEKNELVHIETLKNCYTCYYANPHNLFKCELMSYTDKKCKMNGVHVFWNPRANPRPVINNPYEIIEKRKPTRGELIEIDDDVNG